MNPSLLGSRQFDGAAYVDGLELIQELGTTTLSGGKPIFVSLNNISIFSSLESECKNTNHAPILLIDQTFPPVSMYTDRIRELREFGYHFAIRNLPVHCYEDYAPILSQMDYILIDCQKIDAVKASFYFRKLYPDICICASNIPDTETFGKLSPAETISLFEGTFFRMPVTRGEHKVSPLKINYISLLNLMEEDDFDLTKAADIISQDTALIISLLRLANTRSFNSEITSVRVAVSMLGQKDLTRWIQTTVIEKLCSDKPNDAPFPAACQVCRKSCTGLLHGNAFPGTVSDRSFLDSGYYSGLFHGRSSLHGACIGQDPHRPSGTYRFPGRSASLYCKIRIGRMAGSFPPAGA